MSYLTTRGALKAAVFALLASIVAGPANAQNADPKAVVDDMLSAQVLEALILAGADHPVEFVGADYLGVLDAQGLSHSLPGVLASLFGSLPTPADDWGGPNHAELVDTCESRSGTCTVSVHYVDVFDGERSESAVILTLELIDGHLAPDSPVRLDLAG